MVWTVFLFELCVGLGAFIGNLSGHKERGHIANRKTISAGRAHNTLLRNFCDLNVFAFPWAIYYLKRFGFMAGAARILAQL